MILRCQGQKTKVIENVQDTQRYPEKHFQDSFLDGSWEKKSPPKPPWAIHMEPWNPRWLPLWLPPAISMHNFWTKHHRRMCRPSFWGEVGMRNLFLSSLLWSKARIFPWDQSQGQLSFNNSNNLKQYVSESDSQTVEQPWLSTMLTW